MRLYRRDITKTSGSSISRRLVAASALAAVMAVSVAWLGAIAADQSPVPDQVAGFMRAKLGHSQNVLEGLSIADYDLIERGAQELSLASLDSNWQVLQTEDYVRQSAEFRRSCELLRDAAKAKNLDGATLAWMDVTLKCVQCHKYVRDVK